MTPLPPPPLLCVLYVFKNSSLVNAPIKKRSLSPCWFLNFLSVCMPYGFTIRKTKKACRWTERGGTKIKLKKTSRQFASLNAKTLM